jgi:Fe-S oxidoreductase
MKIEVLHHFARRHGLSARQRLIAFLPRYAPWASRLAPVMNLRNRIPALARLGERWFGIASRRRLPRWRRDAFVRSAGRAASSTAASVARVALLADTFNNYFEPENLHAASEVLQAAGYEVETLHARDGGRALCCGRTFLAAGLVDEARAEMRRLIDVAEPLAERGVPVVGLEPSCLLTLRDEMLALFPRAEVDALSRQALLFEEFLAQEHAAGRLDLSLAPQPGKRSLRCRRSSGSCA